LKLAEIKPGEVPRIRQIKAIAKEIIHRAIVDPLIVNEEVDCALAA
jgi:hypothetical protein